MPMDINAYNTQDILMLVLVALLIALFVITIVLTIQRFKKNLLDDEGYLMFTLPVKSSNLILSKLLVALIYVIISAIVASLSFFIIGIIGEDINIVESFKILTQSGILSESAEFIVYMLFALLINYIIFVLSIYLSLSIGQLPQLSKHKVAAVSPAIIVPRMIKLKNSIPQLIMAGASVDDIFVIVLFTSFTGLANWGYISLSSFA